MPQNPPEGANFALGRRFFPQVLKGGAGTRVAMTDNLQKDNFHNPIFDIDKTLAFGTVDPA